MVLKHSKAILRLIENYNSNNRKNCRKINFFSES